MLTDDVEDDHVLSLEAAGDDDVLCLIAGGEGGELLCDQGL